MADRSSPQRERGEPEKAPTTEKFTATDSAAGTTGSPSRGDGTAETTESSAIADVSLADASPADAPMMTATPANHGLFTTAKGVDAPVSSEDPHVVSQVAAPTQPGTLGATTIAGATIEASVDPFELVDAPPAAGLAGSLATSSADEPASLGSVAEHLPTNLATPGVILADPAGGLAALQENRQEALDDLARAKADLVRDLEHVERAAGRYADAARANDPAALLEARAEFLAINSQVEATRNMVEWAQADLDQVDQAISELAENYPAVMDAATGYTAAERALLEEYHELQSAVAQASAQGAALDHWQTQLELQAEQQHWQLESTIAQAEVQAAELNFHVVHANYQGALLQAAGEATAAMFNPLNYVDPDTREQALALLSNPLGDPQALFELLTTTEILPFDHPSLQTLRDLQTSRLEATEALNEAVSHLEFTVNASAQVSLAANQLTTVQSLHEFELSQHEHALAQFEADNPELAALLDRSGIEAAQDEVAELQRQLDALADARIAHLENLIDRVIEADGDVSWADLDSAQMAALVGQLAVTEALWAGTDAFDELENALQWELQAAEAALEQLLADAELAADDPGPAFALVDPSPFVVPEGLALATEQSDGDDATPETFHRQVDDETPVFSKAQPAEPADDPRDLFGQGAVSTTRPAPDTSVDTTEPSFEPGAGPPPGEIAPPEPPMSSGFDPSGWSWVDDVDLWYDGSAGTFHPAPGAPPVPTDEAPTVVRAGADLLADGASLGASSGMQFTGSIPLGSAMPPLGELEGDDLWFDARTGTFHQGAPDGPVAGFHTSALDGAVHVPNRGTWFEEARQEHGDHLLELAGELTALTAQAEALEASLITTSQRGGDALDLFTKGSKDAAEAELALQRTRVDQVVAQVDDELADIAARSDAIRAEMWLINDTLGYPDPASPYASWHEAELRYLLGDEVVDHYAQLDLSYEATSYAHLGGGDVVNVDGNWFELDESGAWAARDWPTVLSFSGASMQEPVPEFLWRELTAGTDLEYSFAEEFEFYLDGVTGSVLSYDPGAWSWVDAPDGVGGWWEDASGQTHELPGGPALGEGELSATGWMPAEVSLTEVLAVQQVGDGDIYWVDLSTGMWLSSGQGVLVPSAIPSGPFSAVGVDVPEGEIWYVNPSTGLFHSDGGSGAPPTLGPDGDPGFPVTDISAAALAGAVSHHNTGLAHEAEMADAAEEVEYLTWAIGHATAQGDEERVAELQAQLADLNQHIDGWYDDPDMAYVHFGGVEVTFVGGQWLAREPDGTPPWTVLGDGSPYLDLAQQNSQLTEFLGRELAVGTAYSDIGDLRDLGVVVDGATGELHSFDPSRWSWVEDPDGDGGWWADAVDDRRFDAPNGSALADGELSPVGYYDSRLPLEDAVTVRDSSGQSFIFDATTGSFHTSVAGTLQPSAPEPPLELTVPGPHGAPLVLDRPEGTVLHVDVELGVLRDGPDGPVVGGLPGVALQRWEIVDPSTGDVAAWYTTSTHGFGPAGEVIPIPPYVQIAELPGPLRDALHEHAGLTGGAEYDAAELMWVDPATGEIHLWNPDRWTWDDELGAWYDEDAGTHHSSPLDAGEALVVEAPDPADGFDAPIEPDPPAAEEAGDSSSGDELADERTGERDEATDERPDERLDDSADVAFGAGGDRSDGATGADVERPAFDESAQPAAAAERDPSPDPPPSPQADDVTPVGGDGLPEVPIVADDVAELEPQREPDPFDH